MNRWMRILMVAGFSSVYVMQGACTFLNQGMPAAGTAIGGDGVSILPTVTPLLNNIPVIGPALANVRF